MEDLKFLRGKTAVVTGGTRGIGWAIARFLSESGAAVGICGRDPQKIDERVRDLEALTPGAWGTVCDVRKESDQTAFFGMAKEKFRHLDICVPCAGEATLASVTETSLTDWARDIETNLTGRFLTIREALRWMKETGSGGFILPVLSQASKVAFETRAAYCASKWGALGLVECARLEAKKYNVRMTALLPASVATDFQKDNPRGTDWMLDPRDVAEAVRYALTASDKVELHELWLRCWNKGSKSV
ncbi:SDR family NAD(P)-dependent oxidoreductase [bacterium]|nr:SDR family NAD(P)-dependent oxidoreductase [bacterium]